MAIALRGLETNVCLRAKMGGVARSFSTTDAY